MAIPVDETNIREGAQALQEAQAAVFDALVELVQKLIKKAKAKEKEKENNKENEFNPSKKKDNLTTVSIKINGSEMFRAKMNEKEYEGDKKSYLSQEEVDYIEKIVKLPVSKERHKDLDKDITITVGNKNMFVLKDGVVEKNLFQEQEKTVDPKETEIVKAPEQEKYIEPKTTVNKKSKQIIPPKILENVKAQDFSQEQNSPMSEAEEEDAFFESLSDEDLSFGEEFLNEKSITDDEFLDIISEEQIDNSTTLTTSKIEEPKILNQNKNSVVQQKPVMVSLKNEVEQTKSDVTGNTVLIMDKPLSEEKSTSNLETPSKPKENLVSKTVEFLKKTVEVIKDPIKAMKEFTLEEDTSINYFPDEEEELQPKAKQEKQAQPVTPIIEQTKTEPNKQVKLEPSTIQTKVEQTTPNTGFSSVPLNELDDLFEEEIPPNPVIETKVEQEKQAQPVTPTVQQTKTEPETSSQPVTPTVQQTKAEPETIPISSVEIVNDVEPESVIKKVEFSSDQQKQLQKDGIDPDELQNVIDKNAVNRSPIIIIINKQIERSQKPNVLKDNLQKISFNIGKSVRDFSEKVATKTSSVLNVISREVEAIKKQGNSLKDNLQKISSNIGKSVRDFSQKVAVAYHSLQEDTKNKKSDLDNVSTLTVASALLDRHGKKNTKGVEQFETKSFRLERLGDNLRVSAKDGRGAILSLEDGKLDGNLNKRDVEQFKAVGKELSQVAVQSRGRSKQSEVEVG